MIFGEKFEFHGVDDKPDLAVRGWFTDKSEVAAKLVERSKDALSGKNVEDIKFKNWTPSNLHMNDSRLTKVRFDLCRMAGDFRDCYLENVSFLHCDLSYARFDGAVLIDCSFRDCNLSGANFSGAVLENTSAWDCSLRRAVFRSTLFSTNVYIGDCSLSKVDFSGSYIEDVTFCGGFDKNDYLIMAKKTCTALRADALDDDELEAAILLNEGTMPEPTFIYSGDVVLDSLVATGAYRRVDGCVVIPTSTSSSINRSRSSAISRYVSRKFHKTMESNYNDNGIVLTPKTTTEEQ